MRVSGFTSVYEPPQRQPVEAVEGAEQKEDNGFQKELSEEDKKRVQQLKSRDAEVRAHERAHAAAGGHMAGAPSYEFETGPDGQRYAVGGEVSIKMPSAKDPTARAAEARQVRAAATAPSKPSGQDMKVAAAAAKVEQEALAEAREEEATEGKEKTGKAEGKGETFSVCENCGAIHGLDKIQVEVASQKPSD